MGQPYTRGYGSSGGGQSIVAGRFITSFAGALALDSLASAGSFLGQGALPLYLQGKALNTWYEIVSSVASNNLKDYSGVALREEPGLVEVAALLMGGHQGNYLDNTPYTISLTADAPGWVQRRAAGNSSGYDTTAGAAYYADGTPAPRHTYWDIFWCPERAKYIIGGRFWGGSNQDRNTTDGFNPATNNWDPAGTFANNPGGLVRGGRDPATGMRYAGGGVPYKWNPNTDAWSTWPITGPTFNRGVLAWDTSRNQFYHISSGDNFSAGSSTISSAKVTTAGVSTAVTINASAAYSDFVANAPGFLTSSLAYSPEDDCFFFYDGIVSGQTGKIYKITPNAGAAWDMTLVQPAGSVPPTSGGGVQNRFFYVAALRTLFLVVPNANIFFVRLA